MTTVGKSRPCLRRPSLCTTLWMISVLSGCSPAGEVTVTGIEDFGTARSAVWVVGGEAVANVLSYTPPDPQTGSPARLEEQDGTWTLATALHVETERRACQKRAERMDALVEASEALYRAASGGSDLRGFCEAVPDFYDYLSRASESRDAYVQQLTLAGEVLADCDAQSSVGSQCLPLTTGDYPVEDDSGEAHLSGRVFYSAIASVSDYYAALRDGWSVDDCAVSEEVSHAWEDVGERWSIVDGIFTVESYEEEESIQGTLMGALADENGVELGTVSAAFTAERCELRNLDYAILGL